MVPPEGHSIWDLASIMLGFASCSLFYFIICWAVHLGHSVLEGAIKLHESFPPTHLLIQELPASLVYLL